MEKGPRFIGGKYSPETLKDVNAVMAEWSNEALVPIEGEREKALEEAHMIKTANELIRRELMSLGIAGYKSIEPARVHVLDADTFEKNDLVLEESLGGHSAVSNNILINRSDAKNKAELFAHIMHEMLHYAAMQRFHIQESGEVESARSGYRLNSSWLGREAFRGFNEIMVENTVMKILSKHQSRLSKEFGITEQEIIDPSIYGYLQYHNLLATITEGIAHAKSMPEPDVFKRLERGQFEGTILAIKDIARVFGKEALRVLSCLGVLHNTEHRDEMDRMVIQYFATTDDQEKILIAQTIQGTFGKYRLEESEQQEG